MVVWLPQPTPFFLVSLRKSGRKVLESVPVGPSQSFLPLTKERALVRCIKTRARTTVISWGPAQPLHGTCCQALRSGWGCVDSFTT